MAGNRANNRTTKKELEARIDAGAEWLITNPDATWKDFIDWFKGQYPNVTTDRWANEIRKKCYERVGKVEYGDVESARRIAIQGLQRDYKAARDAEDLKLAFAIKQELNKIQGLYTQKIQVEDVTEQPIFDVKPIQDSTVEDTE